MAAHIKGTSQNNGAGPPCLDQGDRLSVLLPVIPIRPLAPSGPDYLLITFHSQLGHPRASTGGAEEAQGASAGVQGASGGGPWGRRAREAADQPPPSGVSLRAKALELSDADMAPTWPAGHSCSNPGLGPSSLERKALDGLFKAPKRTQEEETFRWPLGG